MYFVVSLTIKEVDYLNRSNGPFTLQKYTENWDIADYEVKFHSLPVVEKVEGILSPEEVDLSVLLEIKDIEPTDVMEFRATYKEIFEKGKGLIKNHLDEQIGHIITHF